MLLHNLKNRIDIELDQGIEKDRDVNKIEKDLMTTNYKIIFHFPLLSSVGMLRKMSTEPRIDQFTSNPVVFPRTRFTNQ